MCAAVWIVFNALNLGNDAVFVTLEINDTVVLLVPTTLVTHGDTAMLIAACLFGLAIEE